MGLLLVSFLPNQSLGWSDTVAAEGGNSNGYFMIYKEHTMTIGLVPYETNMNKNKK